jgi:hypothetical protein
MLINEPVLVCAEACAHTVTHGEYLSTGTVPVPENLQEIFQLSCDPIELADRIESATSFNT